MIGALRAWTLWWFALFGLWDVMQGTNEKMELAAGAGAAAVGASFAELARRHGLLGFAFELRWLAKAARVPWRVVFEFAVVAWALVVHLLRARNLRSVWDAVPFPAGGDDSVSAGRRAAAITVENFSPNTIGVDIDCEREVALRHNLDPRRTSPGIPG